VTLESRDRGQIGQMEIREALEMLKKQDEARQ
jgi:hypothetical protein